MKKKVLALALILVMALTVGLVACKSSDGAYLKNQTVREFAVTQNSSHSGLAFVTVTTNAKGEIATRELDEAFIPNEWAKLSVADANQLGAGITESAGVYTVAGAGYNTNVVALLTTGGAAAVSLYPKYIELTIGGVAKTYQARGVTIANNSAAATGYGEATETKGSLVAGPTATPTAWAGLTNYYTGAIRYYEATTDNITNDTASTVTTSLEKRLSTDKEFAAAYVDLFKTYELTGTANVNTTAIKYLKDKTITIDTVRKAARADYAVASSTGAIAIGAAMKTAAGPDLTGNALAYATTFFKRNSAYTSRMAYLDLAENTNTLTTIKADETGWATEDAYMQAWIDANIDNITVAGTFAMAKDANALLKGFVYNGPDGIIATGASSYHTNIYLGLYVKAYAALAVK
jgi:hypothetical protein